MELQSATIPAALRKKPHLGFWDIWNMSFGFLGIQFGFALQNANVSRIFETLGASVENIPILWIATPVTGLLVQPIVGYFSDRTWGRLGRRRPYFLGGAPRQVADRPPLRKAHTRNGSLPAAPAGGDMLEVPAGRLLPTP